MADIYGQLVKAQLENQTSDPSSPPEGLIYFKTDDNLTKWYDGAAWRTAVTTDQTQTLTNKTIGVGQLSGAVAIANGGTGQATATAGFDALAPTTTKGDIIVSNGSDNIRFAAGTNGYALTAQSGETSGLLWAAVLTNPMDSAGDLIYGGAAGVATKLDAGTDGYTLVAKGAAAPLWNSTLFVDTGNSRVGVGTTSPGVLLHVYALAGDVNTAIEGDGADCVVALTITNDARQWVLRNYGTDADKFQIRDATANAQRLTINASGQVGITNESPAAVLDVVGDVLLGGTSSDVTHAIRNSSTASNTLVVRNHSTSTSSDGIYTLVCTKGSTTETAGTNRFILFNINAGGTTSGYIGSNSTNAAAFFSSSDRRLKENIQPMHDALDTLRRLNPVTFTWKESGQAARGFVAQELAEVLPHLVHRTDDGHEPLMEGVEPWSMTDAGMIPYLVKAIQEQQTFIELLSSRLRRLEGY